MKRWYKRFAGVALTLALIGSALLTLLTDADRASASSIAKLSGREFGAAVSKGPQAFSVSLNDAVVGQEDGRDVMYTTVSTNNAVFNVIDIKDNKLLRSFALTGVQQVWRHSIAPDGTVYIGTVSSPGKGELWKYSPVTKTVVNLGEPLPGEKSIWSMTVAPDGKVYGGTFQRGEVFQYDPGTGLFRDYGSMIDGQQYVRSMAYYEGYLYAGIGSQGDIIKLDVATGEKESIFGPVPGMLGVAPEDVPFVYDMAIVDGYLLAKIQGSGFMDLLFYDMGSGQWMPNRIGKSAEGGLTGTGVFNFNQLESRDGKIYLGANGHITEIDLATQTASSTGIAFGSSMRSAAWVTFDDQTNFPGESLVTMQSSGKMTIFNFTLGTRTDRVSVVNGVPIARHNLERGPDGKLYMSGYPGGLISVFDPGTDETVNFPLGQAEGMAALGTDMYFGVYPDAIVYKLDTTSPSAPAAQQLFEIEHDQDRPYIMKAFGDKLYIGTIAGYGKLPGALTIYDPAAGGVEVYENVVTNQGIVGLAEKDGILFGSTTITPGLGVEPTEQMAKIFVWDTAQKKKIIDFTLNIPELDKPKLISGLTFGSDGLLWGAVDGVLFAMNPDDYSVVKYKDIYPAVKNYGMWRPIHTHWGEDGLLYTDLAGKLTVVDPNTMEHVTLPSLGSAVTFMTIAKDADGQENIYYLKDDALELMMIPVTDEVVQPLMKPVQYAYTANTSFDNEPLGNWNPFGAIDASLFFGRSEDRSHSGTASFKIVDNSNTLGGRYTTYPVAVQPNTTYTISMWHYVAEGQSSDDAILQVYVYDSVRGNLADYRMDVTDRSLTQRWVQEKVTFTTPSNADHIRIMPNSSAWNTFTAYYDDVTLTVETDASNLPGELALGDVPGMVVKGDTISIPVLVNAAKSLHKVQAIMTYDETLFDFVSLEPSDSFKNGHDVNVKVHTDVAGTVDFNLSHTDAANAVTADRVEAAMLVLEAKEAAAGTKLVLKRGSELSASAPYGGVLNEDVVKEVAIGSGLPKVKVTVPVTNDSFEQPLASGVIPGWSKHYADGLDFALSTERSRSGSSALKIVDESTSTMGGYMSYPHAVHANQKYEVSMWINIADGEASDDAVMLVYAYAASGSDPIATYRIDVKAEDRDKRDAWTRQSVEFVTPDDAAKIRFMLYSSAYNTFTAYYDDIALTTELETADTTGALMLEAPSDHVLVGDRVELLVSTNDAVDVSKVRAGVTFDADKFEFVSFEPLNGFGNAIAPNASEAGVIRFQIAQSGSGAVNGDVDIAKVMLKAKDEAEETAVLLESGAEVSSTAYGNKSAVLEEQPSVDLAITRVDSTYVKAAAQSIGDELAEANRKFDRNGDGRIDIVDVALLYLKLSER
ncbi:cohesin domain-containing protein [Paenibacillus sp. J5C_2022]|uniref:cohesin domain-containing protein n=1 Tax=Paenibacillus sp. J5C2022 TaxID=2977129 RepID=UPI0021CED4FB|nr:cohesin domain-containing protein [Paenibacillus sp. J5C2022]MCU6710666.1 cohesin domain-containing protein [Paenibacillus sp. J5C2022]